MTAGGALERDTEWERGWEMETAATAPVGWSGAGFRGCR